MACAINLDDLLPQGATTDGTWDAGTGNPDQILNLCLECDENPVPPAETYTQPAVTTGFSGSTWNIPNDQPCGEYKFKYVTADPYNQGDECLDCNDCAVYTIEIVEGPEVENPDAQIVCEGGQNQKGINIWGLFDCGQDAQSNPAPTYDCPNCSGGFITRPVSCIVFDALDPSTNWDAVAGTHTGAAEGTPEDNANCTPLNHNVVLSFSPAYADLVQDYNPETGQFVPNNLTPGESVEICVTITAERVANSPVCDDCEAQSCFILTRQAGDFAGEGFTVQACN